MRFSLRSLVCAVLLCALSGMAASPNIVMIVSDDQAWTDYSFMGHPQIKTPNIDRLAKQSLTFPRGYVPSSLCCPSLASIITGQYPHQHKVTSNDPPNPNHLNHRDFQGTPEFLQGRDAINRHFETIPTLPRLLKEKDYLSFQTGKWWQGNFSRGGFTHGMTKGSRHGDEGLDIGRKTMQPIYDFISEARKASKPFFVWYAPMMPHQPHNPPERLLKKYRDIAPSLPVARYWANVEWFDETCGALLDYLDQQGLSENTIVVYVADNGWIQDPDSPNYLPNSKQSQYDGGLRTPIMIRWPGKVKPAQSGQLAMSIDLAPTLLRAVGLKPAREMPGIDLLNGSALKKRKAIFGECFTHDSMDLDNPAKSLRWRWGIEGDWKLIVPFAANEPDAPVELYNLHDDPHETRNLASTEPKRVAQLQKSLDRWWNPATALRR